MNDVEFRALLDWRMCSDPWPDQAVSMAIIDDWIARECHHRGYKHFDEAYHEHQRPER